MSDLKTRLELLDEILTASDVTDVTTDAGVDTDRDRVWTTPDGRTRILVHAVDHIGRLMCDVITTMDGRQHTWLKVRHWEHEVLVRVLAAAGVVRLDDDGEDADEQDGGTTEPSVYEDMGVRDAIRAVWQDGGTR